MGHVLEALLPTALAQDVIHSNLQVRELGKVWCPRSVLLFMPKF